MSHFKITFLTAETWILQIFGNSYYQIIIGSWHGWVLIVVALGFRWFQTGLQLPRRTYSWVFL